MPSRKPAWLQLFILLPIMFVLLGVEYVLPLPGVSAEVVDAGIVVFTFVAMLAWVQLNGGLLEWYEVNQDESSLELKITVYEPASKRKGDGNGSGDSTPFVLADPEDRLRGENLIQLTEKDKWSLN